MKIYSPEKKILVIKFGGLGDVILSLDAIYSIFNHHKCRLFLLTEQPFDELLFKSKWFEKIITIRRSLFYFLDILQIKKKINTNDFDFVYDLQTSKRSSYYLKLFNKEKTITNGIGRFAKIVHSNKNRNNMHTMKRQKSQMLLSQIKYDFSIDLRWLFKSNIKIPKDRYILIVPGGSRKRMNKRIPLNIFLRLTDYFLSLGIKVILLGSKDDEIICGKIEEKFSSVINLCNKTNFFDLGKLSEKSFLSIGNDTGPMHLISKGGNETFVLFTKFSKPELCQPIGKNVSIFIYQDDDENFYKKVILKLTKILSF